MSNSISRSRRVDQSVRGRKLVVGACLAATTVLGSGLVTNAVDRSPVAASVLTSADVEVFAGIEPVRLLDTRNGVGTDRSGPFGPGETRTLSVGGVETIPANASSVAINVTLPMSASTSSFVTVWPSGRALPDTSTSNATPGQAVPNAAITALGTNGALDIFNETGDTHIVIDVVGFYVKMSSVEAAETPGGALYSGVGAPSDRIGEAGDYYIEELTAAVYKKLQDEWGQPMMSFASTAPDGPGVIADDGPPSASDGEIDDTYLDTEALEIYGPKTASGWGAAQPIGPDGVGAGGGNGIAFLSGTGVPAAGLGSAGDLFIDSTNAVLYGPKTAAGWGVGVDVGPDGGPDGVGSTLLTGAGAPDAGDGANGDTYFDTTNAVLYGPKTAAGWGVGVDVGPDGGPDGVGSTFLSGPGAPDDADGTNGDTYLDTDTLDLYGPKAADAWSTPVELAPDASILTGSGAPGDGDGDDGEMYLDTVTFELYGPKSGGSWGDGTAIGPDGAGQGSSFLFGSGVPDDADGANGDLYLDHDDRVIFGPKTDGLWGPGTDLGAESATGESALSASNTAGLIDLTLLGETPLVFDTPGVSTGSAISRDDADTFLLDAGVYEVSYSISTVGLSLFGSTAQVQVNGADVGTPLFLADADASATGVLLVEAPTDGSTLEIVTGGLVSLGVLNRSSIVIEQISAS